MKLSELTGKEIINLHDGACLGVISSADLVFEEVSGEIIYLLISRKGGFVFSIKYKNFTKVSWETIKKIGPDAIIIEMGDL